MVVTNIDRARDGVRFFVDKDILEEGEISLEEERQRTGRYLAAGIVLFLVGLGLYHLFGSTKLPVLLGAAMIMFLYLVWMLFAARRKKRLLKTTELAVKRSLEEVFIHSAQPKATKRDKSEVHPHRHNEQSSSSNSSPVMFSRSYSVG